MRKILKYSKPSAALLSAKKAFFTDNAALLKNALKINMVYSKQPRRTKCKNCDEKIGGSEFSSHGIPYVICKNCNHLNGGYEDTQEFVNSLYQEEGGSNYKKNYLDNYDSRVEGIYLPKVEFMHEVLTEIDCGDNNSVLDIGCGGGHFVKACEIKGIPAHGYDPSEELIELGTTKMLTNTVSVIGVDEFDNIIKTADSLVISMIGVLEHVRHPNKALEAFTKSKARFLYLSLPLFSFSALLEHSNQSVFPRQLSGGHTHLYTKESIEFFSKKFGLETVAEWWFGTDIVDLFRHLSVRSNPDDEDEMAKYVWNYFGCAIDQLQNILDRQKLSSEVHIMFKK